MNLTPKEMYDLLPKEDKEIIDQEIAAYIAAQSSGQPEPCPPR